MAAGETLALAVPSVLAPPEVNVMLSCAHPDFNTLDTEGLAVFPISPRLTPDVVEETIGGGNAGV